MLDPSQWDMLVGLIQYTFCRGNLAEECACQTLLLIQKRNGNFRGIRLVELIWKNVTGELNLCLTEEIQFHNTLHNFCTNRGTRTASHEVNLLQRLVVMRGEVLNEIFWIFLRPMTPWTTTSVSTYWQHIVWYFRKSASSSDTGIYSLWSPGPGDTTVHRSRNFAG